jgi:hypothetical protein
MILPGLQEAVPVFPFKKEILIRMPNKITKIKGAHK